ncbi:MAG: hypothetical protein WKF37_15410 [Bryobacteraceae bacterium]
MNLHADGYRETVAAASIGGTMGDRAYVEIVCHESDAPLFEAIGLMEQFRTERPKSVLALVDAEASNGNCSELQLLAENGVVFRGWHDAGDNYDGACFAGIGGRFYEVARRNHSDLPCIEVHVDGTVDVELLAAREYLKMADQVAAELGLPSGSESTETTP